MRCFCLWKIDKNPCTLTKICGKRVPGDPFSGTRFMPKFTETFVANLVSDGRDYILSDTRVPRLKLRVTPSGTKIYLAKVRIGGRERKVPIGRPPGMTVSKAREEALQLIADARRGADPVVERKVRRQEAAAGGMTIAQLADKWMRDYVRPKLKPRTVFDYERLLEQHINPALGHLSVTRIDRDDIVQLHVDMQRTPRRANYVISTVRALINFGIDLGLRPPASNPARRIKMYREKARERFLSEPEIAKAADAIERAERAGKIGPHGAAGLRLALFTGARSGEITAIEWTHIDWHRRLIRLPDSKINEPRTIHLSEAALEVL